MLSTVVLSAALSLLAGPSDGLAVANVQCTYGARGLPRPNTKFLPGDQVVLTFDITGIQVDDAGKVLYSMTTEVADGKGKVHFRQDPRDLETVVALGGQSVPAFVRIDVGLEQPAGDYTLKVTVTDRAAKHSALVTQTFTVLPKDFGLVRLTSTTDAEGLVSTALFPTGGSLFVNFGIVAFLRDEASKQPDVALELRVLDENGQPTLAKPFTGRINRDVPASAAILPGQFLLALNRPGKFTVELKATDKMGGNTVQQSFPLTVVSAK